MLNVRLPRRLHLAGHFCLTQLPITAPHYVGFMESRGDDLGVPLGSGQLQCFQSFTQRFPGQLQPTQMFHIAQDVRRIAALPAMLFEKP